MGSEDTDLPKLIRQRYTLPLPGQPGLAATESHIWYKFRAGQKYCTELVCIYFTIMR